ncbi:hypothetical protein LSM04_002390 [Trypanosoma melophagium]|uniref:uncharacterized protein n=1 Tax=Trypanosoma melophagium TaxID=715481 RepID=UPI00351A6807|nr:hypothetical protein LSM04_002390 [Trypanosoma melophagium]
MTTLFTLSEGVKKSCGFGYVCRKCVRKNVYFSWVIFIFLAVVNFFHTAEALEVPVLKEGQATFELSPLPASPYSVPHGALKNYAFILNDGGTPFSMDRNGRILLEVRSSSFNIADYTRYIVNFMFPAILGEKMHRKLFFMLTQSRLYCLYLHSLCASPRNATSEDIVMDSTFMELETKLLVKIFEFSQWQHILKRLSEAENIHGDGEDVSVEGDQTTLHQSFGGAAAILCSVPAVHTIFIEDINAVSSTVNVWVSEHQMRMIAVLIQCSNIPLTVGISFKMFNDHGKGSLEYFSTEIVYMIFFVAYFLLLSALLMLILPCCCSYRYGVSTQRTHSREEKEQENTTNSSNTSTGAGKRVENRSGTSVGKRDVNRVNLREQNNSRDDTTNNTLWSTDERNENNNEIEGQSGRHSIFRKKIPNICGSHMFILYPTLQWLVLVCLFVRMIVCALRIAQYHGLAMSANATPNGSIGIPAVVLSVSTRTAIFAMQQFVCIGWGCAYKSPPTNKTVVASLASIIGFSVFVVVSTCEGSTMIITLAGLDGFLPSSMIRCVTIRIVRITVDLLGSLLNFFQLTTLMSTIGRAALSDQFSGKASVLNENMLLYLRYRGMCVPYALGIIVPQILFIIYSESSLSFDDFYIETAVLEFLQWYPLVFVLLFLRKEPMFY